MAWPALARKLSPAEFKDYVNGLSWSNGFYPEFIVVHNTASPSLAQRPDGLTLHHIKNLEGYYKGKGWRGGPHLFNDDHGIWLFNDLRLRGTHSPSWNGNAIGIEMLGDFDREEFTSGRGALVRANTVQAMAALNNRLGWNADNFRFHIEDKKSDHACPGKKARADREQFTADIEIAMKMVGDPTFHSSVTAQDDLNVRARPGGSVVGGVDKGTRLSVLGEAEGGFIPVEFKDAETKQKGTGWVDARYVA